MISKVILILFFNYSNPDSSMILVQNFTNEYKFLVLDTSTKFDEKSIIIESDVKYAHNFKNNNKIKVSSYFKKDTITINPLSTSLFFVKVISFKRNDWHDMIYYTGTYKKFEDKFLKNLKTFHPIKAPIYVLAKEKISFNGLRDFLNTNALSFKIE